MLTSERRPVEFLAPGVAERQPVCEPLQTGLKAIDAIDQRPMVHVGDTHVSVDARSINVGEWSAEAEARARLAAGA